MNKRPTSRLPVLLIAALAVLAVAGYFGWRHFSPSGPASVPANVPVAATPVEPQEPAASSSESPAPAIQHPIEAPAAEAAGDGQPGPLPALDESDNHVGQRLSELLGRQSALTFLQLDGFVRRTVATVDNLARSHAPVMAWPVNPTPQRFATQRREDGAAAAEFIHPDNSLRYRPLVQMIESVDTGNAVGLYRRLYPLFQQAYEELGFPGRYFNDRLVQVLDHLIATPVHTEPLAVTLVEVKGPVPSVRPWVRYEFADPALESLSAGQKILLRVGPENHRRLQAKLVEIRERVARR